VSQVLAQLTTPEEWQANFAALKANPEWDRTFDALPPVTGERQAMTLHHPPHFGTSEHGLRRPSLFTTTRE